MSNNPSMQAAFPFVFFGSIGLFVLLGVLSTLMRRNLHDEIGQGGLFVGDDAFGGGSTGGWAGGAPPPDPWGEGVGGLESDAERELEIRQMLTARSERLVRRGQAPLDVDAELARLMRPEVDGAGGGHDAALTAEVRQLVLARNERRRRQDLEPLDVEAEVQRTLAELDP
jgi:hypothetical protein